MEPITASATAPFWGPVAGSMIGGLFGMIGQDRANSANLDIARENREWQGFMSNTAHQRAVTDLKAAGLNPILAAGNAASTPQGSTAVMENSMQSISSAAQQIAQMKMVYDKQKQEINLIKAQTAKTDMERKVMSKGLPEADLKNMLYDSAKKYFQTRPDTMKDVLKKDKNFNKFKTNPLE